MLRTNSKAVQQKMVNFILENVNEEALDNLKVVKPDYTFKDVAKMILDCAKKEKKEYWNGWYFTYNVFVSWCQDLPSMLNTACYMYYGSAVELLGDILEETKEERNRFSECQAEEKMHYLIYKTLINA